MFKKNDLNEKVNKIYMFLLL